MMAGGLTQSFMGELGVDRDRDAEDQIMPAAVIAENRYRSRERRTKHVDRRVRLGIDGMRRVRAIFSGGQS